MQLVMALPARPHVFLGIFVVFQIKFSLQGLPSSGKSLIYFGMFSFSYLRVIYFHNLWI